PSSTHTTLDCTFLYSSLLLSPTPPRSTLFPYTTLFRSSARIQKTSSENGAARNSCAGSAFWTSDAAMAAWHSGSRRSLPGSKESDRKSTRLNSSHVSISYAVFCLKKKNTRDQVVQHDVH